MTGNPDVIFGDSFYRLLLRLGLCYQHWYLPFPLPTAEAATGEQHLGGVPDSHASSGFHRSVISH